MGMSRHLVIPDTQVKPGVCVNHLNALGHYILDQQPDTIVMLGDWADMPSLCVSPSTLILKDDLSWAPAGTLNIGDGIVGFNSTDASGRTLWYYKTGKVTQNNVQKDASVTAGNQNKMSYILVSSGTASVWTFYRWECNAEL